MRINIFKDIYNIMHLVLLLSTSIERNVHNCNNVHFITFRKFFPNGGAGGGGAVLSANKIIFNEAIDSIPLKYSFYEENRYSKNHKNNLWDLYGAVEFVKQKVKSDNDCVYVTHDYGTAFGLALLGEKYILVSHIQGSRVEEKMNFGEKFTVISKWIIQYCENFAFKKAESVYFPSQGAYEYFCKSKYKTIKNDEFKFGGVLYNTLYAYPTEESVEGLDKEENKLTFLSVGQLTIAKGMDKHPAFFKELLQKTSKNIRYIFVGRGPLKKQILNELSSLKDKYSNFEYEYIESCSYSQMQYLQNISDVYLMLHRISIFDLTTLEVMNKSKCVILSNIGGNPEFNKEENIILCDDYDKCANDLLQSDLFNLGKINKLVYDKYFSQLQFKDNYSKAIHKLLLNEEDS